MSGNLRVGATNLVDAIGATVACTNADPDYPASNVQLGEIGTPFRSADLTSTTIVATLASAVTLSTFGVAMIKHNLQVSATYDLVFKSGGSMVRTVPARAANADGFWPTKIDGQSRNIALYQDSASLTFDSVELTPSDGGNPDGYFEIPRLFIGSLIEPPLGFSYGWGIQFEDPSQRSETPGGNMVHRKVTKRRIGTFDLKLLKEAPAWDDFFATIDALAGKTGDCLVLPLFDQPTRLHMRALWGPQNDGGALTNPVFQRYSRSVSFRERT